MGFPRTVAPYVGFPRTVAPYVATYGGTVRGIPTYVEKAGRQKLAFTRQRERESKRVRERERERESEFVSE